MKEAHSISLNMRENSRASHVEKDIAALQNIIGMDQCRNHELAPGAKLMLNTLRELAKPVYSFKRDRLARTREELAPALLLRARRAVEIEIARMTGRERKHCTLQRGNVDRCIGRHACIVRCQGDRKRLANEVVAIQ
jgi:hypothetical protein